MSQYSGGLPGLQTARSTSPRHVITNPEYLPGGKIISGAASRDPLNTGDLDVLRAGVLMGKITSGGKYAPSIIGITTNAEAVGSTAVEAGAAVVTELARRQGATGTFKLTGPPIAGASAITEIVTYSGFASSTAITVTALSNAFVAGSLIQPTDGSEVPITLITDEDGIKVTDPDGTSQDTQFPLVATGGDIDSSQIVNWPSDAGIQDWITNRMSEASKGKFKFDHGF